MVKCTGCSSEIAEPSRFCSACGTLVLAATTPVTEAATIAMNGDPSPRPASWPRSTHPTASDFDDGRFLPGTLLAQRYRIVGRLGKGGMGEVYRATDLRLAQTVALKFLPESAIRDPGLLARFYNEVRIARQLTHP